LLCKDIKIKGGCIFVGQTHENIHIGADLMGFTVGDILRPPTFGRIDPGRKILRPYGSIFNMIALNEITSSLKPEVIYVVICHFIN
jgi:hypothetical protein